MPQEQIKDGLSLIEDSSKTLGFGALVAILLRAMYKMLRAFTSKADSTTSKNEAEIKIIERLEQEISLLRLHTKELELRIKDLTEKLILLRHESNKANIENVSLKEHIKEILETNKILQDLLKREI